MTESLSNSYSNFQKWMITFTVMLVAIIEVLDITIVNVSLNQMMGAFSANQEEITWILTSYLVSSAIIMPLTGLLVRQFGRRKLLLMSIFGFMIASMLCGTATNITEMVIFRTLQGIFGATLVPLSQFILRATFPPKEQGMAMAVWGVGIMTAPILGPTIGGYITESLNWRFLFYINLPICIGAFILTLIFIKETIAEKTRIDWLGLILLAITIGCFQTFLDRGNQVDWFDSNFIIALAVISFIGIYLFIFRGWSKSNNIIKLQLYKERNFMMSNLILLSFCLTIFGVVTLQPIMLGVLYNYSPETTGLVMAPRGIMSACVMMLSPIFMQRFSNKIVIITGLLFSAYGTLQMCSFSLDDSLWVQIYPGLFQGVGMALVLVPISSTAFNYLNPKDIAEAAGLFSFSRSMGISIGISIMSTTVTRLTQVNWSRFAGKTQLSNPHFKQWLAMNGGQTHNPTQMQLLSHQIQAQASMVAFVDAYWLAVILFITIIPLAFFLKKSKNINLKEVVH